MNDKLNQHTNEHEREADDRLIDWGLRKNAGIETAPDLTDRILAAAEDGKVVRADSTEAVAATGATSRRLWSIGIAAALLLGLVGLYGWQRVDELALHRHAAITDPAHWDDAEKNVKQLRTETGEIQMMVTPRVVIGDEEDGLTALAASPLADEPPLVYPPSEVWEELSIQRRSFGTEWADGNGKAAGYGDGVAGVNAHWHAQGVPNMGTQEAQLHSYAEAAQQLASDREFNEAKRKVDEYQRQIATFAETGTVSADASRLKAEITSLQQVMDRRQRELLPQIAQRQDSDFDVQWKGKNVQLVVDSNTNTTTQNYTVMVPQTRTREESYTVMVPQQKTRKEKTTVTREGRTEEIWVDVEYTEMVPETKTRSVNYTVNVPEQRMREIPVVIHVPKLIDENGNEIVLNIQDRKQLETLMREQIAEGRGPELGGDKYERIHENPFVVTEGNDAVSTFSIDVDTASYTNVRKFLQDGHLPPPDAVRLEELVNYFDYNYAGPDKDAKHPFATHTEVAGCPWNEDHRLVRVAIKGREIEAEKRPLSNLVFLLDVSGSMNEPNKLPLVVEGLSHMATELGENDRVAIVVYAGSEGLALPSTRGDEHAKILDALQQLSAGGSTAGGAGIKLAYQVAEDYFIKGGCNRVILCTDGDFNVGVTSTAELERLAETKAAETGVFLTVLGFGRGNLNDAMMETISNRGNGNYHYIDNLREARRVLVQQLSGTLVTIAKDVKIQVEFNPANVAGYRLLGYENRMLARQDFNDDTKDAGEVGAGHTVTALYEIVPAGMEVSATEDEPLKYQPAETHAADDGEAAEGGEQTDGDVAEAARFSDELLTLRLRYKLPAEDKSTKIEVAVKDEDVAFSKATTDFRFAASVAGFGMLLRDSQYKGSATCAGLREVAARALGEDARGYRAEFLDLIDAARAMGK